MRDTTKLGIKLSGESLEPERIIPLAKRGKRVRMTPQAEMAELADALGSGPSLSNVGWRFESSFRQFRSIFAPFFLSASARIVPQTLENQEPAVFAYRTLSRLCEVFRPCAVGKKAGDFLSKAGKLSSPFFPACSGVFPPTRRTFFRHPSFDPALHIDRTLLQ